LWDGRAGSLEEQALGPIEDLIGMGHRLGDSVATRHNMAITLKQFADNLVRARLFTADELAAFRDGFPPDRRPRKPQDLARDLIHAGKLTKCPTCPRRWMRPAGG